MMIRFIKSDLTQREKQKKKNWNPHSGWEMFSYCTDFGISNHNLCCRVELAIEFINELQKWILFWPPLLDDHQDKYTLFGFWCSAYVINLFLLQIWSRSFIIPKFWNWYTLQFCRWSIIFDPSVGFIPWPNICVSIICVKKINIPKASSRLHWTHECGTLEFVVSSQLCCHNS